jgi:hypothetical protein
MPPLQLALPVIADVLTRFPCAVHEYAVPVARCALCDAFAAELAAEARPKPKRQRAPQVGHSPASAIVLPFSRKYTHAGLTLTAHVWAALPEVRDLCISAERIRRRTARGWSASRALTEPISAHEQGAR